MLGLRLLPMHHGRASEEPRRQVRQIDDLSLVERSKSRNAISGEGQRSARPLTRKISPLRSEIFRPPQGRGGLAPFALPLRPWRKDLAGRYLGSSLEPMRLVSTARAHWRPSRMAQTTSDWPRRASPQAKILGS